MNVAYIAEVKILDRGVTPLQFRLDQLDNEDKWGLMSKITCTRNSDYDKIGLCGQKVTFSFHDGHEVAHEVLMPKGVDPPFSNEDVNRKFRRITRGIVTEEPEADIEQMVLGVETVDDVGNLMDQLVGQTRNPLA